MNTEAGQSIHSILARKELERRSGNGLFMWGIGNPPNRSIRNLAIQAEPVDVIFSMMKGPPHQRDTTPNGVLVWRTFFDMHNVEHTLPPNVLVTSRMESRTGMKSVHYALMCHSEDELQFDEQGEFFDPSAYRNVGEKGGAVSQSQVTALIVRTKGSIAESGYRINLRARLTDSYWVKLAKPCIVNKESRALLSRLSEDLNRTNQDGWLRLVQRIRSIEQPKLEVQDYLF